MSWFGRYRVPPTRALVAFESAARHRSFSRAARELGTFQSAISRQIATLENWVSIRLFERSSAGVKLTAAGRHLREAIASGLETIHRGIAEAEEFSSDEQVVIACSHDVSQFILLPRFNSLCKTLGEHVRIRILTYDQDIRYLPPDPIPDVVFTWNDPDAPSPNRVPVLQEAVRPVCSPTFAATHADVLNGSISSWGDLTFIDYTRQNGGWVTWDDWFTATGRPKVRLHYVGFESYPYVLETAAADRGIALGWRGFVESYLESGALVALGEGFVEFDSYCSCVLTENGRGKMLAKKCLEVFENSNPFASG